METNFGQLILESCIQNIINSGNIKQGLLYLMSITNEIYYSKICEIFIYFSKNLKNNKKRKNSSNYDKTDIKRIKKE